MCGPPLTWRRLCCMLLPSHDAEVDEHTCAGQAGAELSQHVDLLLSWTDQRTLASLRAAPPGLLKPHACLRSLSGDNPSHPSADFLARSTGRTSSLRCPHPRPCRPHTMRFGRDSAPVRLLRRGQNESPKTDLTSSATSQRTSAAVVDFAGGRPRRARAPRLLKRRCGVRMAFGTDAPHPRLPCKRRQPLRHLG